MEKKIGILFDLDGTLLDTLQDLTDATNYALRQFSLPERPTAYIRSILGNGAQRQITLAMPGTAEDPDIMDVLAVYKEYYEGHCQIKTRPYDGVLEAMEVLVRKYPLAVVSNKPHFAVKPLCDTFFPGVYCRGESAECPRKPAPDMVHKSMKDLGVDACVFVGDSEVDVLTAQNAGVPCLSVLWGFRNRQELEIAGASRFCEKTDDLAEILDTMIAEM